MKYLSLLFLGFIFLNAMAQKPKKEILFNSNLAGKVVIMTPKDGDKTVAEPEMHLINRDDRYTGAYYSVTIYTGFSSELFEFLTETEKFCNENKPNVQAKIHNHAIKYEKMLGYKVIMVYEENGQGYHAYRKKDIVKLKKWLAGWIEENK